MKRKQTSEQVQTLKLKDTPRKVPGYLKLLPRVPSSLTPMTGSFTIDGDISSLITNIVQNQEDSIPPVKFVFFLGAQGKEYICTIKDMFPRHFDSIMFVSSNLDDYFFKKNIHYTNTEQCSRLMKYFNVNDPLGGGKYPLNYLFIIDQDRIRAQLPIRIGAGYGHEKYGVVFNQLAEVIDEYIQYFNGQCRIF